jgi:TolB-like protein/Flp pilus assembly protein TadD
MTDIFLSYNREDQAVARRFAMAFEAKGYKVWWDVTLRAGQEYDEITEAALREAKAVVVLWSKKSVVSRWVRAEATLAQRNKTLLPCMIEPCDRPIMFELVQTADLSHWKGNASDRVWQAYLADIERQIAQTHDDPQDPTPLSRLALTAPKAIITRRSLITASSIAIGTGAIAAGLWHFLGPGSGQGTSDNANSVAVLPFANISGDPSQDYFADGLSAEVRAELARNSLLQVAAQTSSALFKTQADGAKAIAQRLGVSFLLEGNARKAAGMVRVNAELIDGKTGFSRWAQTFARPLDNVFEVQSDIASAVALALAAQVTGAASGQNSSRKPRLGGTLNVTAFEHYLRGREQFELAASDETDLEALAQFDAALAADPNYAAAHAARSRTLAVISNQSSKANQMGSLHDQSIEAARRAIVLAPTFADGHSALGFALLQLKLDVKGARAPIEASVKFGGGDADILTGHAMYMARTGQDGLAKQSIARAISLDQLNPTVFRSAGFIEAAAHRYEASLEPLRKALSLNPNMGVAHFFIGSSLFFLKRFDEAQAAFTKEPNKLFGPTGLAIAALQAGQQNEVDGYLKAIIAEYADNSYYQQAQILAQWGKLEASLAALGKARAHSDSGLTQLRHDQFLDPLRGNPTFISLLQSLGFD